MIGILFPSNCELGIYSAVGVNASSAMKTENISMFITATARRMTADGQIWWCFAQAVTKKNTMTIKYYSEKVLVFDRSTPYYRN